MKCKSYVVGALFKDTKRLFYSFSKNDEYIKINPQMYKFVREKKEVLERLNYYEWAHFLARINVGHSTNEILTQHLLNMEKSQVSTIEILIETKTSNENNG